MATPATPAGTPGAASAAGNPFQLLPPDFGGGLAQQPISASPTSEFPANPLPPQEFPPANRPPALDTPRVQLTPQTQTQLQQAAQAQAAQAQAAQAQAAQAQAAQAQAAQAQAAQAQAAQAQAAQAQAAQAQAAQAQAAQAQAAQAQAAQAQAAQAQAAQAQAAQAQAAQAAQAQAQGRGVQNGAGRAGRVAASARRAASEQFGQHDYQSDACRPSFRPAALARRFRPLCPLRRRVLAPNVNYKTTPKLPASFNQLPAKQAVDVTQGEARLLTFQNNILSVFFSDPGVMDARAINARTIAVTGTGPGQSTLAVFTERYPGDAVGFASIYRVSTQTRASGFAGCDARSANRRGGVDDGVGRSAHSRFCGQTARRHVVPRA